MACSYRLKVVFKYLKRAYAGLVTTIAAPLTRGIGKLIGREVTPMTAEEFLADPVGKVLATGAAITTLAIGAKVAAPILVKVAPTVLKAAIPKTIGGAVGTLVIGGLAVTPSGRQLIVETGKTIFVASKEVGEAYGKPEEGEELKDKISKWGVRLGISSALALSIFGILKAKFGKNPTFKQFENYFKKEEPSVLDVLPEITKEVAPPETQLLPEKEIGIEEKPILPPTEVITTTKKPTRRRRAKKIPQVRQSVNLRIINAPTNKNYLKMQMLTH